MQPPGLKLIMVQGPRLGETFDFNPGSKILIGRVVRGNNLTIKDAGISSKHLIIEYALGKWTIEDLDSSNGTVLNSTKLPPNNPVDLHESDTVKLGEYTSILVKITREGQDESVAKLRRHPRRQANATVTPSIRVTRSRKNLVSVGNSGLDCGEIENQSKVTRKGRGRRKKLQEMPPESSEVQIAGKENVEPGEVAVNSREVLIDDKENLEPGEVQMKNFEVEIDGKEDLEPGEVATMNGEVEVDGKQIAIMNCEVEIVGKEDLEPGQELMKNSKVQIEGRRTWRRGGVPMKNYEDQIEVIENLEPREVAMENCEVDAKEKFSSDEVGDREDVEESCNKGEDKVESGFEEKGMDLERMTLGEWFDYMEVYLPKQIIEVTEEMIERMRRKAERVHEYMMEQKNENGEL